MADHRSRKLPTDVSALAVGAGSEWAADQTIDPPTPTVRGCEETALCASARICGGCPAVRHSRSPRNRSDSARCSLTASPAFNPICSSRVVLCISIEFSHHAPPIPEPPRVGETNFPSAEHGRAPSPCFFFRQHSRGCRCRPPCRGLTDSVYTAGVTGSRSVTLLSPEHGAGS